MILIGRGLDLKRFVRLQSGLSGEILVSEIRFLVGTESCVVFKVRERKLHNLIFPVTIA